jgi:hypothetical protein
MLPSAPARCSKSLRAKTGRIELERHGVSVDLVRASDGDRKGFRQPGGACSRGSRYHEEAEPIGMILNAGFTTPRQVEDLLNVPFLGDVAVPRPLVSESI